MILNKQEIKNILDMLLSEDKENAIIAFSCIDNYANKKHLGELLVLFFLLLSESLPTII